MSKYMEKLQEMDLLEDVALNFIADRDLWDEFENHCKKSF